MRYKYNRGMVIYLLPGHREPKLEGSTLPLKPSL